MIRSNNGIMNSTVNSGWSDHEIVTSESTINSIPKIKVKSERLVIT